jgi:hypothetical protein
LRQYGTAGVREKMKPDIIGDACLIFEMPKIVQCIGRQNSPRNFAAAAIFFNGMFLSLATGENRTSV